MVIRLGAVMQIPAARYADKHSCKQMLVWLYRLGPVALIPLVIAPQVREWAGHGFMVAGLFAGLICYALASNSGAAAFMPLLRHNLPVGRQTELFGRICQIGLIFACTVTLVYSLLLGKRPTLGVFQGIFLLSAVAAMSRGWLLRPLRDVQVSREQRPVPLCRAFGRLWANVPFRRLIALQFFFFLALGLVMPFRPIYIQELGFSPGFTAFVTSTLIIGAYALTISAWGRLADRFGSRGVFVLAGAGITTCLVLLTLPAGNTPLDMIFLILIVSGMAIVWGGLDAGTIHRLFAVVPQQNQSLYLVFWPLTIAISMALGSFLGGLIVRTAATVIPRQSVPAWFALGTPYRVLFLAAAAITMAGTLYSLRMRDQREPSTSQVLLHLRLRTQRRLLSGFSGAFLRLRSK